MTKVAAEKILTNRDAAAIEILLTAIRKKTKPWVIWPGTSFDKTPMAFLYSRCLSDSIEYASKSRLVWYGDSADCIEIAISDVLGSGENWK